MDIPFGHIVNEFLLVDLTCRIHLSTRPQYHSGPRQVLLHVTVKHWADIQAYCWDIHCSRGHQSGGSSLVAARQEDYTVQGISEENFYQAQIR